MQPPKLLALQFETSEHLVSNELDCEDAAIAVI